MSFEFPDSTERYRLERLEPGKDTLEEWLEDTGAEIKDVYTESDNFEKVVSYQYEGNLATIRILEEVDKALLEGERTAKNILKK
jgi:hypothetical protein